VPLCPPRGLRLRGGRRSLRVRPEDVSLERDGDALALRFRLPRGSYATVLLEEVFAAPDDTRGPVAVC
jgi:tRNA(Glu) U13 pseudouridine synthase TruD